MIDVSGETTGEPTAVRAVVDRLDHALDDLAALRHDVARLEGVFSGEDLAEWEEALRCAQMDVGTVVHTLVSNAILAGLWPAGAEARRREQEDPELPEDDDDEDDEEVIPF